MSEGAAPLVSVCIDVYNYAEYLPQAIESVLSQTLTDFELIVVDDCSTDDSFAVARRYAERDARVSALRNPANLGMVRNRRACLAAARGKYVKWLHADDLLASADALLLLAELMEANPAVSLAASGMRFINAASEPIGEAVSFSGERLIAGTTVIARCLWERRNLIGGPSAVMFRRSLAARGFDERYFHAADLEMWFHLLEQGCFGCIPKPLTAYRWHERQQTEKDRGTLSQANDQRALLATYLDRPYIRMRPWMKEFLRHDAVRQTLRRCAELGMPERAVAVLREHGRSRYRRNAPWCFLFRKAGKLRRLVPSQLPPFDRPTAPYDRSSEFPLGLNVAGFLKGEYGIGESSRAFARAAAASTLPCVLINIDSKDHRNSDDSADIQAVSDKNPYRFNLMTFSFDYARRFYQDRGAAFFRDRYNIALWYWELERFPARWHSSFDYYDEIWAPTAFCVNAFAAVSPVPVRKITYPLSWGEGAAPDRARFGLRPESRVFLFTFDYGSILARKNPIGLIEAFRAAFWPDDDVVLVLKSINAHLDPQGREQVRNAARDLKVVLMESHLTGSEMASLLASADCYVSLHRSEGLGLGMAQAMALGKPVIATDYSGNLEYMNAENSLLVRCDRVELTEDYGPYAKGNVWAEPDVEHAAELMRRVVSHPDEAAALGERARRDVRQTLNPEAAARQIRERVREIAGE